MPEPNRVSENTFGERFLLQLAGMGISHGPYLVCRQTRWRHAQSRRAESGAEMDTRSDGQAFARFLAYVRRAARSEQSGYDQSRRRARLAIQAEQRRTASATHQVSRILNAATIQAF